MQPSNVYNLCCRHMGKRVIITEKNGRRHLGTITRVDRDMVWFMPEGNRGYGVGYWGFGPSRFGVGIAIGAIAGIALASLFFW